MKKLSIVILLLSILQLSYALNVNVLGSIQEESSGYKETISVNLSCDESLTLNLPIDATNIEYVNGSKIYSKQVTFDDCNNLQDVRYDLSKLEKVSSDELRLERRFSELSNASYVYQIDLPLEYVIDRNNTVPSTYDITYYDTHKLVTFKKEDVYLIYLIKEKESVDEASTIESELSETTVLILLLVVFVIGIGIGYIYFRTTGKREVSVPSFVLSVEEKQVLDVIKKTEGINQKQISNELNFSKARVSHIVNDLEQKKLIRRERFGRSFKVYLDKKVV